MLLVSLVSLASATSVTEIPPFLRGDVTLGYGYEQLSGSLVERGEEDTEIGQRTISSHKMQYGLVFGVAPGAAVFLEIPHYVQSSVGYSALSEMVYDPTTGSGTYEGTEAGTPGAYVSGAGVNGVWIGARGTPFSETFPNRKNRATWLIEAALRTPSESNFWTMKDGEHRGAGPGGLAVRLHTAFSTTFRTSHPYIAATYIGEGKTTVDVYDDLPQVVATGVEVDPANSGRVRTGLEVLASRNESNGAQLSFDLHLDLAYDSYQTVPSGFYLPNVLAGSEGEPIQQSEQLETGAGLAIRWRPMDYMQVDLYGDVAWHLPQRIESPFAVYTGEDTLRLGVGSQVTIRVRPREN